MSLPILTLIELIRASASADPQAPALLGLNLEPLTYGQLLQHLESTTAALRAAGYGKDVPIAIVLPNGSFMATAFLSVASTAVAAPLNPAYSASEFRFYLEDLQARAVIVQAGEDSPVREAAGNLGIPLLELTPDRRVAGLFTVQLPTASRPAAPTTAEDTALVLHTSGTTARPKIVPLSQRTLTASARNFAASLGLTAADRSLDVMPLFHVHGLLSGMLGALSVGGSAVLTPGFLAPRFFDWLHQFDPTYYTAVPTIHQAVLGQAAQSNRKPNPRLRLIRSSSAALPPQVMRDLEDLFGVPVVEAFGMTEGTHQIACNPLPPRMRKPGSVGLPTGVEITILDEQGNHLPAGVTGEIALRGETIITGYLNNPAANAASFTDGWFRTGDQGYRDLDGYLFITGRLKEIINRGGEKVAPREVEEVLLDYSAVQQAVAFAMPDEQMGEEVAAAVVLRQPGVTEAELRQFAAERLAHFKVPCRILILPDIPKGPTGKIQRVGLAEKLGLTGVEPVFPDRPAAPPVSLAERAIARLWSDLFEKPIENIHARFLDLGGNSILAARLTTSMRQAFNVPVQILDLLDRPTIAEQAAWFESYLTAQIEALSDEEVDRELNANHD